MSLTMTMPALAKSTILQPQNKLAELLANPVRFVPARNADNFYQVPYEPCNKPASAAAVAIPQPPSLIQQPVASTSRLPTTDHNETFASNWPANLSRVNQGFNNFGNSCYMNATLQALIHSPAFLTELLIKREHLSRKCEFHLVNKFCALCVMCALMSTGFQSAKNSATYPNAFNSNLQKIAPHFRRGRQEDAHEFMRFLLDAMQSSCVAQYTTNQLKANPSLRERTLIHRLFAGKFRSRVTCSVCHHNSDTFDTFLDLSVHIANSANLKGALAALTKPDELRGQNKYKCEKCKKLVDARKQLSIEQAPHILTIHLKRFTAQGRKITATIAYDEFLSLGEYMSDDVEDPRYRLDAIISHSGSGPHSGHYFSHIRGPNDRWFKFDDSSVTSHSQGGVRQLLGMKTAYILLYTRLDERLSGAEDSERLAEVAASSRPAVNGSSPRQIAMIGPQLPTDGMSHLSKRKSRDEESTQSITDPSPDTQRGPCADEFTLKRAKTEDEDLGRLYKPANLLQPTRPIAQASLHHAHPQHFYRDTQRPPALQSKTIPVPRYGPQATANRFTYSTR